MPATLTPLRLERDLEDEEWDDELDEDLPGTDEEELDLDELEEEEEDEEDF